MHLLFLCFFLQHFFSLLVFVFDLFLAQSLGLPERIGHVYAIKRNALILAAVVEPKLIQQLTGFDVYAVGSADRYWQFDLEEFVLEALACRGPLVRIELQHVLYQLDGVLACVLDDRAERLRKVLRESVVQLVCQLEPLGPGQLARGAENFADTSHLVMFGLSRKQRSHCVQFAHDRAEGEDVDRCVVVWGPQENLRSSVPPGRHVVGKGRLAVALLGQSKVSNFDCLIIAE